jgi:hypothetical protein
MRRSRPFRDIFEECLELMLDKGETVEECLRRYPEHAQELKPLLETATATKKATAVQPSPEFREKARQQFYAALSQMPARKKRAGFSWGVSPRWATVVTVLLALLLVSSGTVAAAQSSMPDQPLYAVKRATEQARLALTLSPLRKAELYAKLADRRVLEIVYLASKNKPEQVQRTTQHLDVYLARIADLAAPQRILASETGAAAPMLSDQTPTLEKVAPLPTATETALPDNATRITADQWAQLRAVVVYQARNNPERLKAALANASPQAKLALLWAIAVSETGYEKALMSLEDQP